MQKYDRSNASAFFCLASRKKNAKQKQNVPIKSHEMFIKFKTSSLHARRSPKNCAALAGCCWFRHRGQLSSSVDAVNFIWLVAALSHSFNFWSHTLQVKKKICRISFASICFKCFVCGCFIFGPFRPKKSNSMHHQMNMETKMCCS